ncbi:MAG: hypothetical protein HN392_06340 [Anaerolineae bacterium]|jgi:hypothetical protein|nr:hypothetical protein [Anaerolineae bacterium]MBT7073721.1 hypothetical protein [Anaerolineae bacterium]MBT7782639.1 hypothetical protein [Anaerolineae bacterium]
MNNKKISRISILLLLIVLFVATMACEQAGEIVPDAEATQRAIPTAAPTQDIQEAEDARFAENQDVVFVGQGYLIPFYGKPGDALVLSHAARGDAGVVLGVVLLEGETWYEVKSVAGTGWITEDFLEEVE